MHDACAMLSESLHGRHKKGMFCDGRLLLFIIIVFICISAIFDVF
jgi:hypothetical protein